MAQSVLGLHVEVHPSRQRTTFSQSTEKAKLIVFRGMNIQVAKCNPVHIMSNADLRGAGSIEAKAAPEGPFHQRSFHHCGKNWVPSVTFGTFRQAGSALRIP
jgi:hypothetical protein